MSSAPLFIPVILGTPRQGRQSEYVAKFIVEQISLREDVETELIDIRMIAIASNPGHLLWSGIVPPERAKRLVERLFQSDLWCGWGIRTLSSQNPAYNPISYQLGSVWPHDNGFIAAGLKRYGYHEEANHIAEAIFAAANYFEAGRMPELFAGIERQSESFPVPYPDANIPQAWAAGSIFFFIRTILGLEADAPNRQLRVQPALPAWLPDIALTNLVVGDAKVALRFWREGEQTRWEVTHLDGELKVYEESFEL